MKFKTTAILFAVFVVLLAFVLLFDSKGTDEDDTSGKLVALSSEDVESIEFKSLEDTLSFKKNENGEWQITSPIQAQGDKNEVDRLAGDFADLTFDRIVEEEVTDLKKYGIPDKEVTLLFKDKPEPVKILIGMENPLDNSLFAKRSDDTKVVLLSSSVKSLLDKKLFDFRKKDIFTFDTAAVQSANISSPDQKWQAEKREGDWWLKTPIEALAQSGEITSLLSSLSSIKAAEFLTEEKTPEKLIEFGLDKPDYTVSLKLPIENQELTFKLHKKDDNIYVTTDQSTKMIRTEDTVLENLDKKFEEFRSRDVADFYSWEVNKVSIIQGESALTVVKSDEGNWNFGPANGESADKDKIEGLVRKLDSLEAESFIDSPTDLKGYGLDPPQFKIKLSTQESDGSIKEITLLIGTTEIKMEPPVGQEIEEEKDPTETKLVIVKNPRFGYLFKTKAEFLDDIPVNAEAWKVISEQKAEIPEKKK
ncbi:DUF4340 domain-containing protein [Acidobacteriota bacterium]